MADFAARLRQADVTIDVLVNNAGVLEHGAFANIPVQRQQQLIDLNVSGLTAMPAEFVPEQSRGDSRRAGDAQVLVATRRRHHRSQQPVSYRCNSRS